MRTGDNIIVTIKNVNEHSKLIRFIQDNDIRHGTNGKIEDWFKYIQYKNLNLTEAISADKKKMSIQFDIYDNYIRFWWPDYNENGMNIFEFIEKYKGKYGT